MDPASPQPPLPSGSGSLNHRTARKVLRVMILKEWLLLSHDRFQPCFLFLALMLISFTFHFFFTFPFSECHPCIGSWHWTSPICHSVQPSSGPCQGALVLFIDGESKALKWAATCLRIHSKWRVRIRIKIPQTHLPLLALLNQDQRASVGPLVPVSSYLTSDLPAHASS